MPTVKRYNTKSIRIVSMAILLLLNAVKLYGQGFEESTIDGNTISYRYTPANDGFSSGLDDYLSDNLGNKKIRFNIFGGPGYSANTGWRLAAIGNLYYRQGNDSGTTPGMLSISATASLTGYYGVSVVGCNHLGDGRHRLGYGINAYFEPTYIWGLDYNTSRQNSAGTYTSRDYAAWLDYRYYILPQFFVDIAADYRNITAIGFDNQAEFITHGESHNASSFGIGLGLGVDTRRHSEYTTRGIYATAKITTRPKFANNLYSHLYTLKIIFDYFQPLWRGATLALDLYGEFHNAATPWFMRAELGGDDRMRGYYAGRYNGDNLISAQLELRQHIWQGLGIAAWGGAGEAFSSDDPFTWHKVLPTYGVGLRWSINRLSTIRLDMAFGRNSRYLILGLNLPF